MFMLMLNKNITENNKYVTVIVIIYIYIQYKWNETI